MPQLGSSREGSRLRLMTGVSAAALTLLSAGAALPQTADIPPSFGLYGVPGLLDMPSGETAQDALISGSYARFGDTNRFTLSFQITPRISGSFRYSALNNFPAPGNVDGTYYDRSFDLRYTILEEDARRPGVVVGLQDFIGTGLYGAEYIVATKTFADRLRVTGGLGWGRLATDGSIGTLGTRPTELLGSGGIPTYDRWFRGDVAPFAGLSYDVTPNVTVKAEYSNDAYLEETTTGSFERNSPWNLGVDYRFARGGQLSAFYMYGSTFGAMFTIHGNPKSAPYPGGREGAPLPVAVRDRADINDLGWVADESVKADARSTLSGLMETDGLVYEGLKLDGRRAVLRMRNPTYSAEPQAIGRAARAMTRALPASVEVFTIIPTVNGVPSTAITLRRSDIERLENAPASELMAATQITDGYGVAPRPDAGIYPRFSWSIAPYVQLSTFDPDNPVRADAGIRASADYYVAPNLVLSGAVTKKVGGNLDDITRVSDSKLPKVRTDYAKYSAQGDPAIEHLTVAHFGRPGRDLYSRVTLGYLEGMYAGISGELLWKEVDSPLAFGAELNYVRQREFDQMFGLQDYDVVTGHVSAYYDFGNGFHGQLDVGRYLAGDYGATVTLDREFANGWRVGAYATVTDVSSEDFGEGSFDKGIRVTVPLAWSLGTPSRTTNTIDIKSLTRDGGARLNVRDRLYGKVRDYQRPEFDKTFGKVWR
ncbi:YjbH domain-containing protein [Mesobacterium pallidum]|uniref:YjbH domain-containing protein n=1 Tax=Mesobacterium pallidum TaxID=2872037 RepID=UPI001EE17C6A|nr:YjbH domain-containing protein [Mesobacterium pallidum]